MPAVSKSQQHFMGMVHAYQTGRLEVSSLPTKTAKRVKDAAGSMTKRAAKDFASTKTPDLPATVKESSLKFSQYLIEMGEDEWMS